MSPLADLPPELPTELHATVLTDKSTRSHEVVPGDTLYDLAARYGTTVAALREHNDLPHGGRWLMPGTVLEVPTSGSSDKAGDSTATKGSTGKASNQAGKGAGKGTKVTVRPGDTLSHLAVRHDVSVAAIVQANGLDNPRMIHAGQVLTIPGGTTQAASPGTSSTSGDQGRSGTKAASRGAAGGSVTIRQGDTLTSIAARHDVSLSALVKANAGLNPQALWVGQQVNLPGGTAEVRTTTARPENIGDAKAGEHVDRTFLHYTYPHDVARSAAANRDHLASVDVPSRDQVRQMVADTARQHGVDPALMLALSSTESGWNQRAVSPANAIGVMQVIPSSGDWASGLVGRELNLLDPQDNITAGTVIMRSLLRTADDENQAIAGYYQGLAGVQSNGMYPDTRHYVATIQALKKQM